MSDEAKHAKALERIKALQSSSVEWMARQAVGDAVLMLVREAEPTREGIISKLQAMARGDIAEWDGHSSSAEKAIEFMRDPPDHLPQVSTTK